MDLSTPSLIAICGLFFAVAAAFLGGLLGSQVGANLFSSRTLQRALGVVLIIVAYKLIVVVCKFCKFRIARF